MTSISETVVDLARSRHPAVALAVADAALRIDRSLTVGHLVAVNEARASSRGRRLARWVLARATPLAETALESVSRAAIEWLGFEEPSLQWSVRHDDGSVDRADFRWQSCDAVGEADGRVKYSGRFGDPGAVYVAEKRREDRMRRRVRGYARWGWREVSVTHELAAILQDAGLRRGRPEQAPPLFSLRGAINGHRTPHIHDHPASPSTV
ncbi:MULTISPECIES: hypothetical protein [unclassified Microbacterium]|uniref:hypothetical protein n=1 Tax=unclassified Microbacterium TaxID=2609290 RepID=UPI00387038FA